MSLPNEDFYKEAFDKIKVIKPNVKDSTIKSYLLNIKKISNELFKSEKPTVLFFKDTNSVTEYIASMKSIASQKNMATSILVLCKAYLPSTIQKDTLDVYIELHKELSKKQEESYLDNVKTEREEQNWITRQDMQDKIGSLQDEIINWNKKLSKRMLLDKIQQHLILNLYYLLPPLRNDYVSVKVVNDPDFETDETKINTQCNYVNIATQKLLLCQYKTDKFYGIKKIDVPELLLEIIVNWEEVKGKHYGEKLDHSYLLLNTTNMSPMKHNTLTKYLNKIFSPKKVSTTILRKVYLSEKYPVVNTYREQLLDSHIMGHSIGTQKMIYSKK